MARLLNAWISPTGRVHHVGLFGHATFAAEYIKANCWDEYKKYRADNPLCLYYQFMETMGWKRITTWRTKQTEFLPAVRWPSVQQRAVADIYIEREEPVPAAFQGVT